MRFVVVAIKAFGNFTISSNGFFFGGGTISAVSKLLFGLLLLFGAFIWATFALSRFILATFALSDVCLGYFCVCGSFIWATFVNCEVWATFAN